MGLKIDMMVFLNNCICINKIKTLITYYTITYLKINKHNLKYYHAIQDIQFSEKSSCSEVALHDHVCPDSNRNGTYFANNLFQNTKKQKILKHGKHWRSRQSAQFPGGYQTSLLEDYHLAVPLHILFCFVLHMASYSIMVTSEAERIACHIIRISSDCVYFVIFVLHTVVSFLSILRSETSYRVCIGRLYMHLDVAFWQK